jgi:hypothetical protein
LLLLIPVAVAASLWAVRCGTAKRAAAVALPPAGGPQNPAVTAGLQLQGVASCASMACHHANGPKGSKGSEYTTWMAHDPHARAYTVLFGGRARALARNLWPDRHGQAAHPETEPLCLSCHVHPAPDLAEGPRGDGFTRRDGVGCEACHGPAQRWLDKHYLDEWRAPGRRVALGMTDTKDLRVRAEVCVRCHVGEREMDVNHRLIAAGHPRLRFEYAGYLANYPRHWKLSDDKARRPDHEARAWLIGQLVSAEAALKLLRHRAEQAGAEKKPWPEFAEYNCAGCHHRLQEPSFRQERGPGPWPAGTVPWGSWYFPLLPVLEGQTAGAGPKARAGLGQLDKLMRQRVPPEEQVAAEAGVALTELRGWLAAVEGAEIGPKQLSALLAALVRDGQEPDRAGSVRAGAPVTWDAATQRYLGIAAVHHALSDTDSARPGLSEAVQGLGRQLEDAFPDGRGNIYDSPSRFDPRRLQEQLRRIQERLK